MKPKLSPYKIATGAVWAVCLGFFAVGALQVSEPQKAALEKAKREVQESQEKLAFAQDAKKDDTLKRMQQRLEATQASLNAFSCSPAEESAMIFQVGQLAHTLQLKKFTSRFPENVPEQTLEKDRRLTEGWLAVEFVADYLKLAAFVNSLERQTPVMFVESMSVTQSQDNPEEASVRMNLSYLIRKEGAAKTVARADAAH